MSFTFSPLGPFRRWLGPFSPARGTRSGFRFHGGQLGTWVETGDMQAFWPIRTSPGVQALGQLVLNIWGGGRVLLLANGFVIKPLQGDHERGQRILIGRFEGPVILEMPDGGEFDLSNPQPIVPGGPWFGPKTTGLECIALADGALDCKWDLPAAWGFEGVRERLSQQDANVARGFSAARPGENVGRVRVTANGHMITDRQEHDGSCMTAYVGWIDPTKWPNRPEWIEQ